MSGRQRKPRRSEKGRGSVYESPKGSGRWYARLPPEFSGGRVGTRFPVGSREEGRALLDQKMAELRIGINVHERWVLDDWLDYWLEEHITNGARSTYDSYSSVLRLHVRPYLGKRWMDDINAADITRWQNMLRRKGLSEGKIKDARARLHTAYQVAIMQQFLSRNPVATAPAPRPRRRKGVALTIEQANALLDAARPHRLYALFALALATGLRRGELLGLHWADVNLASEPFTIYVWQQLREVSVAQRRPGQPAKQLTFTEVKGRRPRTITIDTSIAAMLREHQARQSFEREVYGPSWNARGLVFASGVGTPIYASNFTSMWGKIRRQIGMPDLHFHDLRHTTASLMLEAGVALTNVSEVLGHADSDITARIYLHGSSAGRARAVSTIATQLQLHQGADNGA